MRDILNYTLCELQDFLEKEGFSRFLAKQIFSWIYQKRAEEFDLMSNISKSTRQYLKKNFCFSKLKLLKKVKSDDATTKFLFKLQDNSVIETVLIPEKIRNTLCVSTQVGCKFKCIFCLSGKDGFKRNLTLSEIVNQYLAICDSILPRKITNIVFMGIGEPLDNFTNTIKAIEMLINPEVLNFAKKRISISTCGLIPAIKKLARLNLGVNLAISLHSANNAIRSRLMPINKKYPLSDLMRTIRQFVKLTKYPVTFEYVLVKDINTKKEDAEKLAKLLKSLKAKVNLIPYNGQSLKFGPLSQGVMNDFQCELKQKGIFFTLRKSKGEDIKAACGQLRASFNCSHGRN